MIERLVIVGVGLIGGSLALALRQGGAVGRIVGLGRHPGSLAQALALGVIDEASDNPEAALAGADAVLLAMPVGAMPAWFARIAPCLAPQALVVDAGSTKQDVIAAARAGLGERIGQFVPAHPVAGAEKSGVTAARPDLYAGKNVILTPLAENRAETVARAAEFWQAAGARVSEMTADQHDRVFAAVSHLPHLAAFALVDELASRPEAALFFRHAGSGFRDFTRIAASSPEMWRDIALANRPALQAELEAYIRRLQTLCDRLAAQDGAALLDIFARASAARGAWAPSGVASEESDV